MLTLLSKNWWVIALRGVAAILFGLAALVWPQLTLTVLVLLFGAYAATDGIFALIAAFQGRAQGTQWWMLLLEGFIGLLAGILTVIWPSITGLILLYVIAAWALLTGILEIAAAVALRREMRGEWVLILTGIASMAFGVLLIVQPGAGIVTLAWLIGGYAMLFGILLVLLAFRLRGWAKTS